MTGAIFGQKAECPTEEYPAIRHVGPLPDLAPRSDQLWCIDELVGEALKIMKLGPSDSSVINGMVTVFIRIHLKYRRKVDGAQFEKQSLIGVYKTPELPRGMVVYIDYRVQLQKD